MTERTSRIVSHETPILVPGVDMGSALFSFFSLFYSVACHAVFIVVVILLGGTSSKVTIVSCKELSPADIQDILPGKRILGLISCPRGEGIGPSAIENAPRVGAEGHVKEADAWVITLQKLHSNGRIRRRHPNVKQPVSFRIAHETGRSIALPCYPSFRVVQRVSSVQQPVNVP